jgi:hypothetical protein
MSTRRLPRVRRDRVELARKQRFLPIGTSYAILPVCDELDGCGRCGRTRHATQTSDFLVGQAKRVRWRASALFEGTAPGRQEIGGLFLSSYIKGLDPGCHAKTCGMDPSPRGASPCLRGQALSARTGQSPAPKTPGGPHPYGSGKRAVSYRLARSFAAPGGRGRMGSAPRAAHRGPPRGGVPCAAWPEYSAYGS